MRVRQFRACFNDSFCFVSVPGVDIAITFIETYLET